MPLAGYLGRITGPIQYHWQKVSAELLGPFNICGSIFSYKVLDPFNCIGRMSYWIYWAHSRLLTDYFIISARPIYYCQQQAWNEIWAHSRLLHTHLHIKVWAHSQFVASFSEWADMGFCKSIGTFAHGFLLIYSNMFATLCGRGGFMMIVRVL